MTAANPNADDEAKEDEIAQHTFFSASFLISSFGPFSITALQ